MKEICGGNFFQQYSNERFALNIPIPRSWSRSFHWVPLTPLPSFLAQASTLLAATKLSNRVLLAGT